MKQKTAEVQKGMKTGDIKNCFEQWKKISIGVLHEMESTLKDAEVYICKKTYRKLKSYQAFLRHKGLKLETNPKGKNPKHSKSWRLNDMLLNNEWVKNKNREDIKNFLETNENELTTIQNLWDTAKAIQRGKFIAIQAYLKKIETFQTNNLTLHLQELEEQQQRQPGASTRKEITKIRAE